MRLRIAHTTTYRYEPQASGVIQVLRMTPRSFDGQYVVEWQIFVSTDSRMQMHHDAFGNVTHILAHGPVDDLTIHVDGLVETNDTSGVIRGTEERFPPQLFLRATDLTAVSDDMRDFARTLRSESGEDTLGFLHALMLQIGEHMTFEDDPSRTGTSARDAFAARSGVCHDLSHVFIACARSAGVPARFVSGHYLRPEEKNGQRAGHSWSEAHIAGLGWVGFDPACGMSTTEAHVRVAVGLDHLGAAPVRGTRFGGGSETVSVAVKLLQAGRQSQS